MKIEWTSQTPAIVGFGVGLAVENAPRVNFDVDVKFHAVAAFPKDGFPLDMWLRSLFLTVTSASGRTLYHGNLLQDQIVFPDELTTQVLKTGVTAMLLAFQFDLGEELDTILEKDRYFVHLSAGQFQSSVVVVDGM